MENVKFIDFCGELINISSINVIMKRYGGSFLEDDEEEKNFFKKIIKKIKKEKPNSLFQYTPYREYMSKVGRYYIYLITNYGEKYSCCWDNKKERDEAFEEIKNKLDVIINI